MKKLTIEISSENGDFWYIIDEIKKSVEQWYLSWMDWNDTSDYNFQITENFNN